MFENIVTGQFLPGNSLVHKLDPRTKLISAFIIVFLIFSAHSPGKQLAMGVIVGAVVLLAGVRPVMVLSGMKTFWLVILVTVLVQILFTPGTTLVSAWFLHISREGIYNGLAFGYRLILAVIITNLLMQTTSPVAMADGMEKLFHPLRRLKVPVSELALMVTITLRFIPTLLEEAQKIMKAQAARGAEYDTGNIFRRSKNMVTLLVPLIVSASRRADELAVAMESRGYTAGIRRTRMYPLKLGVRDYMAFGLLGILIVGFRVIYF